MTGLRERQKSSRYHGILSAAEQLFARDGYRATSIESIASKANLATGTVYNYFPSKGDILLALVALDGEEVRAAGAQLIGNPPPDPAEAITGLLCIYVEHALVHLTKEDWRHAMASFLLQTDSRFADGYALLDRKLAMQVGELVASLQRRHQIREDVESALAGRLLFYMCDAEFRLFIVGETRTMSKVRSNISRQVLIILRGLQC
jgi:AcrR family transcriptional regulator